MYIFDTEGVAFEAGEVNPQPFRDIHTAYAEGEAIGPSSLEEFNAQLAITQAYKASRNDLAVYTRGIKPYGVVVSALRSAINR